MGQIITAKVYLVVISLLFFLKFFSLFILETEREHRHTCKWVVGGGRERGREKESQAGSELSVQSPMWGSEPTNCEITT